MSTALVSGVEDFSGMVAFEWFVLRNGTEQDAHLQKQGKVVLLLLLLLLF